MSGFSFIQVDFTEVVGIKVVNWTFTSFHEALTILNKQKSAPEYFYF